MKYTEPTVYLTSRPAVDWSEMFWYLDDVNGGEWIKSTMDDDENDIMDAVRNIEFAGRVCYDSFDVGNNKNVTKIRKDPKEYIANILRSGHGSVLEHANYTFTLHNVSRVLTHELVRHRAGSAFSQTSGRYVRTDEIPFWMPEWMDSPEHAHVKAKLESYLLEGEDLQKYMADYFGLDTPGTPFHEKKLKTSFMRRFLPNGITNDIVWTANVRTIRHCLEVRTAPGAEEEIRLVFDKIGHIMMDEVPILFQDFTRNDDASWTTDNHKV